MTDYEAEDRAIRMTTDYLRRLLIERHYIRAALENPGGSVILTGTAASVEQTTAYSSVVGNDFHLDLLRAEEVIKTLPGDQRAALLTWADGLSARQAADFMNVRPGALRMRRSRAVTAVAQEMNSHVSQPDREAGRQVDRPVGSKEGSGGESNRG